MASQDVHELVRRSVDELWNAGDVAVAFELYAERFVAYDPFVPDQPFGPEGVARLVTLYREAFPDLRVSIEDVIVDGHRGAARWRSLVTHRGPLLGLAPTGRSADVSGAVLFRVQEGKFIEQHACWDTLGLLRQLGLDPAPGG